MPHRTLGDASMRVRKHAEPLRGIWAMLLNTVHHTIARRALLARGGGALAGLALLDSDFANAIPLTLTFAPASIECRAAGSEIRIGNAGNGGDVERQTSAVGVAPDMTVPAVGVVILTVAATSAVMPATAWWRADRRNSSSSGQ